MKNQNKSVIIANLTWNPFYWRNIYINPKAGHKYARKYPGHESLNFLFNKNGIDNDEEIYGYIQWTNKPTNFRNNGIIIYYSNNTDKKRGEIIGIYSKAKILDSNKEYDYNGFQNNKYSVNISANKELSLLFPIPLNADNYKKNKSDRLVSQNGFTYYNEAIAERIIKDEIIQLNYAGIQINEYNKLKKIYKYITGEEFNEEIIDNKTIAEKEIENEYKNKITEIIDDLSKVKETDPEIVYIKSKKYYRDMKTIIQLKILRNYSCQICGQKILKKDGDYYIEAAHIKPKTKKGSETPNNILILCPNHHKEFDYGDRKIIIHTKDEIQFNLNGKKITINLKIERDI